MKCDHEPSRVLRTAGAVAELCWLSTVVLVPLAINPWGLRYELPRIALFQGLVVMLAAAHVVTLAWSRARINLRRWVGQPLVLAVMAVGGAVLLSSLLSISPVVSLRGTFYRQQGAWLVLSFVLWALLVACHLRRRAQVDRLVTAIATSGSLVAATAYAEALLRNENPLTWRPSGTLGNPIFLGAFLVITIPFTIARLIRTVAKVKPGAPTWGGLQLPAVWLGRKPQLTFPAVATWSLALLLQISALLIAQSRGPWVGGLVGLGLFFALLLWPTHPRWAVAGPVAAVLLVAGFAVGLNSGLVPSSRTSRSPYLRRVVLPQGIGGGTIRVRLVLWQMAAQIATTWPQVGKASDRLSILRPLVGYGPDTAAIAYVASYPPELAHIEDPSAIWDRAHNETLDILVMLGWLGLAAYLTLGVVSVRRGLVRWRSSSNIAERAVSAAPLAALTAHVVEVQFAFSLTATAMMAWLCIALLASGTSHGSEHRSLDRQADRQTDSRAARWQLSALVGVALLVFAAVVFGVRAIWADSLAGRARALDQAGQWRGSLAQYDRALALTPGHSTLHQLRAEALYNLARALPEAETDLKAGLLKAADRGLARAIELEPLEVEHYSNAGILHTYWAEQVDRAHLGMAVSYYQQAFRLASTRPDLRADLGHVYHQHGQYREAIEQYRVALQIDPLLADAHYASGLSWIALDRRDLAEKAFNDALALTPECERCVEALQSLAD